MRFPVQDSRYRTHPENPFKPGLPGEALDEDRNLNAVKCPLFSLFSNAPPVGRHEGRLLFRAAKKLEPDPFQAEFQKRDIVGPDFGEEVILDV